MNRVRLSFTEPSVHDTRNDLIKQMEYNEKDDCCAQCKFYIDNCEIGDLTGCEKQGECYVDKRYILDVEPYGVCKYFTKDN